MKSPLVKTGLHRKNTKNQSLKQEQIKIKGRFLNPFFSEVEIWFRDRLLCTLYVSNEILEDEKNLIKILSELFEGKEVKPWS